MKIRSGAIAKLPRDPVEEVYEANRQNREHERRGNRQFHDQTTKRPELRVLGYLGHEDRQSRPDHAQDYDQNG